MPARVMSPLLAAASTVPGHVRTWAEHDAVPDAAWMTPAVYDVYDRLVITGGRRPPRRFASREPLVPAPEANRLPAWAPESHRGQ